MVIQHNLSAMNSNRMYNVTTTNRTKSSEKLSSGYKINRAADDAAGLSISEKMRRQIRGLNQAYFNLQDGVSLSQVADGYLHEVHDMIQRTNELAVKSANGTLASVDREYIDQEVQALKEEMKRIFTTANFNEIPIFRSKYVPEIEMNPEPTDIQVFYGSSGKVGGLEFNNVRYNIAELKNEGLKIDDNGVATETHTAEFHLWDGEKVKLSLKEGESLSQVKRNYEWSADDQGISVNEVLATTWEDLGITDREHVASGNYSFEYHGMKVTFEVDAAGPLQDVINGINGDQITKPSNWDVSVSSYTSRPTAPVSGSKTIAVTAANKNDINDKYYLSATAGGLAIENRTDGTMTARTAWENYSDTNSPSADTINGGYPVVDWGLDVDSNDSSQIKFDDSAVYHFKSPDTNVQIEFDFKLAEVASRQDVLDTLDGKAITGQILTPSELSVSSQGNSSGRGLTISNVNFTRNNDLAFELQRDYGRAFAADNSTDTLSGQISWRKSIAQGEPDDADKTKTVRSEERTSNTTSNMTGASGNVVYVQKSDGLYYAASIDNYKDTTAMRQYTDYSWQEKYNLTYSGSLGNKNMDDSTKSVDVNFSRRDTTTWNDVQTYQKYGALSGTGISATEFNALSGATSISESDYNSARNSNTKLNLSAVTRENQTTTTGTKTAQSGNYTTTMDFKASGDERTAFTFSNPISYATLAAMGDGTSSSANLSFRATGQAQRTFTPAADNRAVSEADFLNLKLNVPEKRLRIQSGSEETDGIIMTWSPLNLTILGLSSTNLLTQESSRAAISQVKGALQVISETRSLFGAYQNRFEHAMALTANVVENTQAAESRIRDTDMAKEMTALSNHNILEQAGQTMLAQANQSKQGILSLLG